MLFFIKFFQIFKGINYFFINVPLIIMYIFSAIYNKYSKENINQLSLLKYKFVKIILIVNKFNITVTFKIYVIFSKKYYI
jgi:hypothetical protein